MVLQDECPFLTATAPSSLVLPPIFSRLFYKMVWYLEIHFKQATKNLENERILKEGSTSATGRLKDEVISEAFHMANSTAVVAFKISF